MYIYRLWYIVMCYVSHPLKCHDCPKDGTPCSAGLAQLVWVQYIYIYTYICVYIYIHIYICVCVVNSNVLCLTPVIISQVSRSWSGCRPPSASAPCTPACRRHSRSRRWRTASPICRCAAHVAKLKKWPMLNFLFVNPS